MTLASLEGLHFYLAAALRGVTGGATREALSQPIQGFSAWVAKGRRDLSGTEEPDPMADALHRVIEKAASVVGRQHFRSQEEGWRAVSARLKNPTFKREVATAMVAAGMIDLEQVRKEYLDEAESGGRDLQDTLPWLESFFTAFENCLSMDPVLGDVYRDLEALRLQRETRDGTRRTAQATENATAELKGQTPILEEMRDSLAQMAAPAATPEGDQALVGQLGDTSPPKIEDSAPLPLTQAEEDYLSRLVRECEELPLLAASKGGSGGGSPRLSAVYVDPATDLPPTLEVEIERLGISEDARQAALDELREHRSGPHREALALEGEPALAAEPRRAGGEDFPEGFAERHGLAEDANLSQAQRPLSGQEAPWLHPRLLVLGLPGYGKSSLVKTLCSRHARALLQGGEPIPGPDGVDRSPFFPIRLVCKQWKALDRQDAAAGLDLLLAELERLAPAVPKERWRKRLRRPDTLLLVDGLDELPGHYPSAQARRRAAKNRWQSAFRVLTDLTALQDRRHLLVTCRVREYRDRKGALDGFRESQLQPLDPGRWQVFLDRWYRHFDNALGWIEDARSKQGDLRSALKVRDELQELAQVPLLLTMLVMVHNDTDSGLPEGKVDLYRLCIDHLLWVRELKKFEDDASAEADQPTSLGAVFRQLAKDYPEAPPRREDFEGRLAGLAYSAQKRGDGEIELADLEEALARLHPKSVSEAAQGRSRPPQVARAWAEATAGLFSRRDGLLLQEKSGLFSFPHNGFREFLAAQHLLACGDVPKTVWEKAAEGDHDGSLSWAEPIKMAAAELQDRPSDLQALLRPLIEGDAETDPEGRRRLLLAAEIWRDWDRARFWPTDGSRLDERIPALLTRLMQSPQVPEIEPRAQAAFLLAELCGPADGPHDPDLRCLPQNLDDFVPLRDAEGHEFQVARYPVTNAQFREFVKGGGYDPKARWWSAEAREDFEKYRSQWPEAPAYWQDPRWNLGPLPVVGVSWHEALAYCAWLETREAETPSPGDSSWAYRLLTAREWQVVAGGLDPEARLYPWGQEPEPGPTRLNDARAGLQRTTPVHLFPSGGSPEGVLDLAGNVWEWIVDEEGGGRGLRGKEFYSTFDKVASARGRLHPFDWSYLFGFRVCRVPSSRAPS